MRMNKGVLSIVAVGMLFLPVFMGSCSPAKEDSNSVEKAESVAAVEEANQMEAAKEGREAAKEIVTKNWPDSMQLQQAILDARAKKSKYEMAGKKDCTAAYDTAFFNAVRTARPDLADQLKP